MAVEYIDIITGEIKGPVWKDECEHPPESYISSFERFGELYDIYVFPNGESQEVCIRFGDSPEKYISPSTLDTFIEHAHISPVYRCGLRILRKHGVFRYKWLDIGGL